MTQYENMLETLACGVNGAAIRVHDAPPGSAIPYHRAIVVADGGCEAWFYFDKNGNLTNTRIYAD